MSSQLKPSGKMGFKSKSDPLESLTTVTNGSSEIKTKDGGRNVNWIGLYDIVKEDKRGRTCTKFTDRMKLITCIFVAVLFVGLLTFFLWPRIPDTSITGLTFANGDELNKPIETRISLIKHHDTHLPSGYGSHKTNFYGVTLKSSFTVYSTSYVPIFVDDITVIIEHGNKKIGGGHLTQSVTLKPRSDVLITLPIDLVFIDTQRDMSTINLFRSSCNPDPTRRKQLDFHYTAKAHLGILKKFGVKPPEITGTFDLDCAWNMELALANGALATLTKNITQFTIPSSVTPSFTPSGTPSFTPSFTPSVTPSFTPSVTPSVTPPANSSITRRSNLNR